MQYLLINYGFLSTPSVGAEFLVDLNVSMFLYTPNVGASYYAGVHDLDLGGMITFSTRFNKTYKTQYKNK